MRMQSDEAGEVLELAIRKTFNRIHKVTGHGGRV